MTGDTISRAAALDALNGCTEIYLNNLPPTIYKEDAIKALKAQPSATDTNVAATDTISRAAVWDALNRIEISRNASWYEFYQKALTAVGELPFAQPEYERVSAEDVAVSIAPTKLASAVWLYGTLTELEKAGYVICRRMT